MAAEFEVERLIVTLAGQDDGFASMVAAGGAGLQELDAEIQKQTESQEEMEDQVGDTNASLGDQVGQLAGLTASLVGTALAVKGLADAYAEAELEAVKLNGILTVNERNVGFLTDRYSSVATTLSKLTTTGDDAVIAMFNQAEALGVSGSAAERAVKNALGLSAAIGMNTHAAMRFATMLEQGDTMMLTRYIPTLRLIKDQNERVREAQDKLNKMFAVAEAEAQSFSGQVAQAADAYGNLQEVIGEVVAVAILPLVKSLKAVFEWIQTWNKSLITIIATIGVLVFGLAPALVILNALWPTIVATTAATFSWAKAQAVLNAALYAAPYVLAAAGIAAVVAAIGYAYVETMKWVTGAKELEERIKSLATNHQSLVNRTKQVVDEMVKGVKETKDFADRINLAGQRADELAQMGTRTTKRIKELKDELDETQRSLGHLFSWDDPGARALQEALQAEQEKLVAIQYAYDELRRVEKEKNKSTEEAEQLATEYIKTLNFQSLTMGMTADEIEAYKLKMAGASEETLESVRKTQAYVRAQEERLEADRAAKEAVANLGSEVDQMNRALDEHLLLLRVGADEARLLALEEKGASEIELEALRAKQAAIRNLNEENNLRERAKQIIMDSMSPLERYQAKMEELEKLRAFGLDDKSFAIAADKAKAELEMFAEEAEPLATVDFKVTGIEAVAAGSAEALARLEEYRAGREEPRKPALVEAKGGDGASATTPGTPVTPTADFWATAFAEAMETLGHIRDATETTADAPAFDFEIDTAGLAAL